MNRLVVNRAPGEVRKSVLWWLVAIAAGLFETMLAVSGWLPGVSGDGMIGGVLIRAFIFAALAYVVMKMHQGNNWARIALAVLLGGFGTASLLIDPVQWLLEGHALSSAFEGADIGAILFALSRLVHLTAVAVAFVLMFRPAANRYFRKKLH